MQTDSLEALTSTETEICHLFSSPWDDVKCVLTRSYLAFGVRTFANSSVQGWVMSLGKCLKTGKWYLRHWILHTDDPFLSSINTLWMSWTFHHFRACHDWHPISVFIMLSKPIMFVDQKSMAMCNSLYRCACVSWQGGAVSCSQSLSFGLAFLRNVSTTDAWDNQLKCCQCLCQALLLQRGPQLIERLVW